MTVPVQLQHTRKRSFFTRPALWRWRLATAAHRELPQFLIICASRSGNFALYRHLVSHPQVKAALDREVEFFSNCYLRGADWYRAHFPLKITSRLLGRRGKVITGESSPFYLPHPRAAERICKMLPDVKLIVLLREPVARAYSHYIHEKNNGHESLTFETALAAEDKRISGEMERMREDPAYQSIPYCRHAYVHLGEYSAQLEPYLRHFSRDRMLVIRSEDMFADPQTTFNHITRFLGLENCRIAEFQKVNSEPYRPLIQTNPDLAHKLREHYRPHNAALYAQLGVSFDW